MILLSFTLQILQTPNVLGLLYRHTKHAHHDGIGEEGFERDTHGDSWRVRIVGSGCAQFQSVGVVATVGDSNSTVKVGEGKSLCLYLDSIQHLAQECGEI